MTAPVGARAEEAAGRTIRDLVGAWQAQASRCNEAFLSAIAGINRELDAVGGYATTSPEWKDGKCYCRDYWRQGDTFGGGVSVVGEDAGGDHAGKVTPHEPEVGDRCFALEQAWRREATALTDAVYAVRERVASVAGHRGVDVRCGDVEGAAELGLGPEHVALALIMEGLRTTAALEVPQPDRDDVDPETIIRMHLDGRPPRKYVPVDGVELQEIVGAAVARATEALTTAEWGDRPLPEDSAISAAFPTRSGKHAVYGEAMRMVGACQSKGRLVRLVNWLLVRIDEREGR